MLGVTLADPSKGQTFGFRMANVMDPTDWYVNTIGQTLIFSDKYIQMDFQLPSQNLYGLGDRVHQFKLKEGAFSLWSSG